MILKAATRDFHSVIGNDRWLYLDRVAEVQHLGVVRTPTDESQPEGHQYRISVTRDELIEWVERAYGTERGFGRELWPEFDSPERRFTVHAVMLTRDDDSIVLALLTHDAFLLSDGGDTVDRLR